MEHKNPLKKEDPKTEGGSVLIMCVMSAMKIIAIADGTLSQAEKEILVQIFASYKRHHLAPAEILQQLQQMIDMFAEAGEMGWQTIMATGRSLPVAEKLQIMDAAGTIAILEGDLHPRDEKLIIKIAEWIELPQGDFAIWWQNELQPRLMLIERRR